jgi:two-component system sensor histidine kinase KdpD
LRTHTLARDLLDLARLQSETPRLALDWLAVDELVGSALQARAHALRERALTFDLPEDLPLLRADAVLMERVVCNLIDNAIAHTTARGQIVLSAQSGAGWLCVSVCDDGCGLPPGREQAIFERFVRAPHPPGAAAAPTATGDAGTGLGLAIVQAIMAAHGGHVSARNRAGGGACFVLHLPLPPQPERPPPEDNGGEPS